MRKKYTYIRILCMFVGYMSIGLFIGALIITIFGHGSIYSSIAMVIALATAILGWSVESHYQEKIDEIDYKNL